MRLQRRRQPPVPSIQVVVNLLILHRRGQKGTETLWIQTIHTCIFISSNRKAPPSNLKCTPNTLTVQIPYPPTQSLPNLGSSGSSQQSSCNPPPEARSGSPAPPCRGTSYPPLSPKSSLRRSKALQQSCSISGSSLKSKNRGSTSDGITIPVITGVPSFQDDDEDEKQHLEEKGIEDVTTSALPEKLQPSRKGRTERGTDARRYHTAGAIEDIKVSLYPWVFFYQFLSI